ncbi:MAG: hypothetical protein J6113_07230, partial [Lachnospiraceae bacterium]|nr:hypothetical protein [Lachnospiraceae bacterium]
MSFQKHYKKMIAVLLIFSMLFAVSACWSQGGTDVPSGNGDPGTKITEPGKNETPNTEVPGKHGNTEPAGSGTVDLMANVIPAASALKPISAESSKKAADFALKLFKACYNGENTLVSPLSLIAALGMTMEGAKGETLAEMEKALGFTSGELTDYIATLLDILKNDEVLSMANSIWFTSHERFTVDEAFLKRNAAFYKAGIFKSPFDDTTVVDVNNWVREKTHDMIDGILDECKPGNIMFLINALAFEGEWEEEFKENRISDGKFTTTDGQKVDVKFMSSEEDTYLVTEKAEGFIKYYKGRKYAFAALLPNEGVSISDVL